MNFAESIGPAALVRRGRRCPVGAHAGAVSAALRLPCGARLAVASPNSLRSLCSLRSDNGAESVYEARCARRPRGCGLCRPRRSGGPAARQARTVHRTVRVRARPRRPRDRPHRAPPAALNQWWFLEHTRRHCKGACGQVAARLLGRREAQGLRPRAQRELSSDSSPLFERRERSERSEFGDGAARPSIAGQSTRSVGRSSEAPQPARKRLCRSNRRKQPRRNRSFP
jgi:hypothetical protein